MENKFLTRQDMLTVILQCDNPDTAIGRIRNANMLGADADTRVGRYHTRLTITIARWKKQFVAF